MVAAWIRAETGVGPAIASGSQVYNGICADFPVAPKNNNNVMAVSTPVEAVGACLKYRIERDRTKLTDDNKDRDQKTNIADAVHHEGFFCGVIEIDIFKPVSDQQIGAKSNAFPSDKEDNIVRTQYQEQHEKTKRFR